jgi:hypothetical protein
VCYASFYRILYNRQLYQLPLICKIRSHRRQIKSMNQNQIRKFPETVLLFKIIDYKIYIIYSKSILQSEKMSSIKKWIFKPFFRFKAKLVDQEKFLKPRIKSTIKKKIDVISNDHVNYQKDSCTKLLNNGRKNLKKKTNASWYC